MDIEDVLCTVGGMATLVLAAGNVAGVTGRVVGVPPGAA